MGMVVSCLWLIHTAFIQFSQIYKAEEWELWQPNLDVCHVPSSHLILIPKSSFPWHIWCHWCGGGRSSPPHFPQIQHGILSFLFVCGTREWESYQEMENRNNTMQFTESCHVLVYPFSPNLSTHPHSLY